MSATQPIKNKNDLTRFRNYYKEEELKPRNYALIVMGLNSAFRIIKKAADQCGLREHISCHSLRKTFGYYAWKQGIPPALLMSIYNHSSYEITKRYLCIDQQEKDKVYMEIQL